MTLAYLTVIAGLLILSAASSAQWADLVNGKNLDGWEAIGDGNWTVMRDGTLLGQRNLSKSKNQSWLYTKKEFGEFDLELEYWIRFGGNSGAAKPQPWKPRKPEWRGPRMHTHGHESKAMVSTHRFCVGYQKLLAARKEMEDS